MAGRFRRYGLPFEDLVQKATGLIARGGKSSIRQGGARFSTYAASWIKASMQDYVMRHMSVVRAATNGRSEKPVFQPAQVQSLIAEARGTRPGRRP